MDCVEEEYFLQNESESDNYSYYYDTDDGNMDMDTKCIPYPVPIEEYPLWEVIVKSYIYAVIMVFSLIGNALIVIVVLRHPHMRTTTNYYIVNLAVADILVTVFCTWVHLVVNVTHGWILGEFFCKFNSFSQVMCLVASVLSLTLIAYDRFFGIVFALKAHMTNRKARTSLVIIWLCSLAVASPILVYRKLKVRQWRDYEERWCDDEWPVSTYVDTERNMTMEHMPARSAYYAAVSVVLYFFPMIAMTVAYSVIIWKLRISTIPGEHVDKGASVQQKTKRKVIAMLVAILSVFGICWLPCQIVLLYSELRTDRQPFDGWFHKLEFAAWCLAFSNSALNPLIYAGFNKNFKQGLQNLWRSMTCQRKSAYMDPKTYGTYTNNSTLAGTTAV